VLKYIFNQIEDKYPKTRDGAVPLHFAAKGGILENCDFLIKNVSDINPVNLTGWTPLHLAVSRGHLSICHLFIENGVNKSSRTARGITTIHIAAQFGNFRLYEYLFSKTLEANSSANAAVNTNNNGWTALHSAAQEGHIQI
jgi:ankyrin repeat protein